MVLSQERLAASCFYQLGTALNGTYRKVDRYPGSDVWTQRVEQVRLVA